MAHNPLYTAPAPTYKSSTMVNDSRLEVASLQLLAALIASGEGKGLMSDATGDYRDGLADKETKAFDRS